MLALKAIAFGRVHHTNHNNHTNQSSDIPDHTATPYTLILKPYPLPPLDIRSDNPLSYPHLKHKRATGSTTKMSDCPHNHIQDSGLQAFRDFIREETDGGRDIVRFLKGAVNREYSNYKPHHELEASRILTHYGYEDDSERDRRHKASKSRPVLSSVEGRSSSNGNLSANNPIPKNDGDRDPAIDDFRDLIRQETNDGLTIVRNLVHMMETREDPYKPQHNLAAAKELIYNGFPITDALLCSPDCTHHAPAHPERSPAESNDEEEPFDEEVWEEILAELKRKEEAGILHPDPNAPKIDISSYLPPEDFDLTPYLDQADAFWAKNTLRLERQKQWPEIEERRRKKLEQIYPSHSEDEDGEPPDT